MKIRDERIKKEVLRQILTSTKIDMLIKIPKVRKSTEVKTLVKKY